MDFAPGRIVWKQPQVSAGLSQPVKEPESRPNRSLDWLLGETLTNLYVGLAREKRGEKLSAARFIQEYAVDRLLELAGYVEIAQAAPDKFANDRRFEQRYPGVARHAAAWMQGYERNHESALAILAFLEGHFEVNKAIAAAIRELCT